MVAEPEAFDDHGISLTAGHREPHAPAGRTICDALMALIPGEMTFAINSKLLGARRHRIGRRKSARPWRLPIAS